MMKSRFFLVLLLFGLISAASISPHAFATSTYDNVVHTTNRLFVTCYDYSSNSYASVQTDVSNLWQDIIFTGSVGRPVDTSNVLNYTDATEVLSDRLDEDSGWALVQMSVNDGGVKRNFGVRVVVARTSNQFATFGTSPNNGNPSLTLTNAASLLITCDNRNGGPMKYYVSGASASEVVAEIGNATQLYGADLEQFQVNMNITYPSGYDGAYPPAAAPSIPATIGSVSCGNEELEYMLLTQDGATNPVTLNYSSVYQATWVYPLTESDYIITVGCGSKVATSVGGVSPVSSSNDWVCDDTHNPSYCVLS